MHLAVFRVRGEARLERRHRPLLQRIWRLHVVMAVEQDVERRAPVGAPMAHHHGLAGGSLDPGREADLTQGLGAPVGSFEAGCVIGRIGGNARDGEKLEQAVERGLAL